MKGFVRTGSVLFGVLLLVACGESPTEPPEPEPDWVYEGQWGSYGEGDGQFNEPCGLCLNASGSRVYVADYLNNRIQYFRDDTPITPASLGRVRALFR